MPKSLPTFEEAVATWDSNADREFIDEAERQRAEILKRFPLEAWPTMELDRYALGLPDPDTYCRWLEFRSHNLGSIKGGSARKMLIFMTKEGSWYYADKAAKDVHEAWRKLREAFVTILSMARDGAWGSIDDVEALKGPATLRLKTLHLYFPSEVLPIYSTAHLKHFQSLLGLPELDSGRDNAVHENRALLAHLRSRPQLAGWSTNEMQRFLYAWAHPRAAKRIVKISPGDQAMYWDECLAGGYVCVGWDEVGDLREFEDKSAFRDSFEKQFGADYNNLQAQISKKANELWTLVELNPGDIVIANKGISRIMAIGEVIEPGYEWEPSRSRYRHVVRVKWNTDYAQEIEPIKQWGFVTVAPVKPALYERLLRPTAERDVHVAGQIEVPTEPFFDEIAEALERRGQAILYGPPGTGKTFAARRFAVQWLLHSEGHPSPAGVLADATQFKASEQRLSTAEVTRRAWWIVANPKEWAWEQLFRDKSVDYRYGRLRKNYSQVQAGDLVIGYQSNPDKRIVALARVSKPLGAHEGDKLTIQLEPVAKVGNGVSYDELKADPLLAESEPLRFNNQGTLFALTREETEQVVKLLIERNPHLDEILEDPGQSVGPLTRLTFHPSYSYEDFVEGFRPVEAGASGGLTLRLESGIFKRVCRAAQAKPKQKFLVLIDEVNRANVAKVFGELITLLEKDKRDLTVTLPQSKESFSIPSNVYLLGTMNTADRSIKLLDVALRRRFAFLECMPEPEILRGATIGNLELEEFLEELNRRIIKREGREKQIGHAFLLQHDVAIGDADEFARRFRHEILPLLQEYCYADYASLAEYLGKEIVDAESHALNDEVLASSERLLEALEREFQSGGEPT